MPLPVPFGVTEWECEWYTEDDYLAWEEHSPVRWEFRPAPPDRLVRSAFGRYPRHAERRSGTTAPSPWTYWRF